MNPSAQTLRKRIAEQARRRCGYCLTLEAVSGIPLTLEHIIPKAKGGQDIEENLWLSCRLCNEAKGVLTEAIDPQTGNHVPLFNPRTQVWAEHFTWSKDGTHIIGQTPIGRATVSLCPSTASCGCALAPSGLKPDGTRRSRTMEGCIATR